MKDSRIEVLGCNIVSTVRGTSLPANFKRVYLDFIEAMSCKRSNVYKRP